MAESTASPSPPRSIHRGRIRLHLFVQVVMLCVIFGLANYLSCRHYERADLTANRKFTLSTATTNFLKGLSSDIDIYVAFLSGSDVRDDVRTLVEEYQRNSRGKITVEYLDPVRHPDRAAEIKGRYNLDLTRNSIILAQGARTRILLEEDLIERDKTGEFVTHFNGEIALTAALIELTEERQRKLYILSGYHKADFLNALLEELTTLAARQNTRVAFLSLGAEKKIPDDADALILPAPQIDLPPDDMRILANYFAEKRGAVFMSLDPDANTPLLHAFLRRHGVAPRDDRVLYAIREPGQPLQKIYSVVALLQPGNEITRRLGGLSMTLEGRSQSLELFTESDLIKAENIHLTPLIVAETRYWGETDYAQEEVRRDRTLDHHAPLFLGATIERGAVDDPNLRVDTQRMIVVSNPTLLSASACRQKVESDFIMAGLNWLMDRTELIGVSPKEPTRYVVDLTPRQKNLLDRLILYVFPGAVALIGLLVWGVRRT